MKIRKRVQLFPLPIRNELLVNLGCEPQEEIWGRLLRELRDVVDKDMGLVDCIKNRLKKGQGVGI